MPKIQNVFKILLHPTTSSFSPPWADCFEKASLKGIVSGGGIDAANTAASHVDVMKKAYELGKELQV